MHRKQVSNFNSHLLYFTDSAISAAASSSDTSAVPAQGGTSTDATAERSAHSIEAMTAAFANSGFGETGRLGPSQLQPPQSSTGGGINFPGSDVSTRWYCITRGRAVGVFAGW